MKYELIYSLDHRAFFIKRKVSVEGIEKKNREYLTKGGSWLLRKSKFGFGDIPIDQISFNSQRYALSFFKRLEGDKAISISKWVRRQFK
jgi:hypothetical protein